MDTDSRGENFGRFAFIFIFDRIQNPNGDENGFLLWPRCDPSKSKMGAEDHTTCRRQALPLKFWKISRVSDLPPSVRALGISGHRFVSFDIEISIIF